MNKEMDIFYGFEIEGCFNNEFLKEYNVPDYHNPQPFRRNKVWRYERDGSLYRSAKFRNEVLIEFTTTILKNKNEFFKALTNFRRIIFKNKPLNEVMVFNNSMGCHIHISTSKKNYFSHLFSLEDYTATRKAFFEYMNKSKVLSDDTRRAVINQYNREHSTYVTQSNFYSSNHYREFNRGSELIEGQGLEWRGFNLCGVKNWDEFNELFNIAYKTLEFLLKRRFSKKKKLKRDLIRLDFKDTDFINFDDEGDKIEITNYWLNRGRIGDGNGDIEIECFNGRVL